MVHSIVMSTNRFPLGDAFPHEGFVQASIERYFADRGFLKEEGAGDADLVCSHPVHKEHWVVEAKGQTTAIGLDFRTGLGQLLQRMEDPAWHYAMAIPKTPAFMAQCEKVSPWVRRALRIHWLLVDESGNIEHLDI